MRKAAYALCLSLILPAACKSSSPQSEEMTPGDSAAAQDAGQSTPPSATASQKRSQAAAPKGAPQGAPADQLERDWQHMTLAEQKKAFLVDQHIAKAKELKQNLQLQDAERELAQALELEPDNLEAKNLMAEVGSLLGKPTASTQTMLQDLGQQYDLRVQQMREEARDNVRKAKVLIARGDYDGAIVELNLALDHIRWAPYSVDWQGLDKEASQLLDSAQKQKQAAAQTQEKAQRCTPVTRPNR